MKTVNAERFVEKIGCDVYPITLVKYLMNRGRILSYFQKAANGSQKITGTRYLMNPETCGLCDEKKEQGILCRRHTSIHRIMNAEKVAFDVDANVYIYKNEIFRDVGGRFVIVYCPHPKLISGKITDSKVRRITITTIDDPEYKGLPEFRNIFHIVSSDLMNQYTKCWFNTEFSIVTIPEDRNGSNWCLVPNR